MCSTAGFDHDGDAGVTTPPMSYGFTCTDTDSDGTVDSCYCPAGNFIDSAESYAL